METWTDDETAFERTAKEELVGEDEEGIDTELGMIDAEDETEYLMPLPEDEASAWLLSSRDLCCPLISVGHHGQEGLRLREGLQRRLTGVPVLNGHRKLPIAACNCGALDKLIVLSERLGIAARSGGALPPPAIAASSLAASPAPTVKPFIKSSATCVICSRAIRRAPLGCARELSWVLGPRESCSATLPEKNCDCNP